VEDRDTTPPLTHQKYPTTKGLSMRALILTAALAAPVQAQTPQCMVAAGEGFALTEAPKPGVDG